MNCALIIFVCGLVGLNQLRVGRRTLNVLQDVGTEADYEVEDERGRVGGDKRGKRSQLLPASVELGSDLAEKVGQAMW